MRLTTIKQTGQQYLDEPQFFESVAKPIAVGVAKACNQEAPKDLHEFSHYQRTQLNWIRPKVKLSESTQHALAALNLPEE